VFVELCVLVAGLPDWPFVGQISENWRRFKLVGLKRLVDLLPIFRPHLKLDGLKNVFGLFYAQIGSYGRNILLFHFIGSTLANFL